MYCVQTRVSKAERPDSFLLTLGTLTGVHLAADHILCILGEERRTLCKGVRRPQHNDGMNDQRVIQVDGKGHEVFTAETLKVHLQGVGPYVYTYPFSCCNTCKESDQACACVLYPRAYVLFASSLMHYRPRMSVICAEAAQLSQLLRHHQGISMLQHPPYHTHTRPRLRSHTHCHKHHLLPTGL